ncbi:septin 5b [Etheostoma cragini]|uniref:septin 5b n=1 Tax=Etheostoma cragini TaxID=417921 RepID=UPI00155E9FBA|nr:septin 5b [Etheostoma cragini]
MTANSRCRSRAPRSEDAEEKDYVGFATLPNQVHRKSVKKGFDFTLMVAGETRWPFCWNGFMVQESTPFAVIGSNTVVEARGQRVRGRLYPWGIVEVENPSHCDFVKLRTMLIRTHMHDLKDITNDVHYENYRAQCIHTMTSRMNAVRVESPIPLLPMSTSDVETEKLIKRKDDELRKMQQMLQKMQQQMHDHDL